MPMTWSPIRPGAMTAATASPAETTPCRRFGMAPLVLRAVGAVAKAVGAAREAARVVGGALRRGRSASAERPPRRRSSPVVAAPIPWELRNLRWGLWRQLVAIQHVDFLHILDWTRPLRARRLSYLYCVADQPLAQAREGAPCAWPVASPSERWDRRYAWLAEQRRPDRHRPPSTLSRTPDRADRSAPLAVRIVTLPTAARARPPGRRCIRPDPAKISLVHLLQAPGT